MKLTLPMLWSAFIAFAALVILPWLLMPAAPDSSPVLEAIRGRLERMTHLLEQQNRLLATTSQADPLSQMMMGGSGGADGVGGSGHNAPMSRIPVGSPDSLQPQTEAELRLLIQELRAAVGDMSRSGTRSASWQPNAVRASLHSQRERNQAVLQAMMIRLEDDDQGLWDEFYFRSLPEILAELGRPDNLYSNKGQFFITYNNVPCMIAGEEDELDLDLRFQDGICVGADIN
jgi:hypothetical protein